MADHDLTYTAPPTVAEFMKSPEFLRLILGPVGSGKSVGCTIEILRRCLEMPPGPDGIRRSRWCVIRNTLPQLKDTTLKTFLQWVTPGVMGYWREQERCFYLKVHDVEAEILFRPLDTPEDVQRVLSLELTGAWMNECRSIPASLLFDLQGRVGRYPRREDVEDYWCGVIADTNPPDEDTDWYKIFEGIELEEGNPNSIVECDSFKQPSGISAQAENTEHLRPGYYDKLSRGRTSDWVNVYVHGMYGLSQAGKPVYRKHFKPQHHISPTTLNPDIFMPVIIGMDFGRTPAAVFMQMKPNGRLEVQREAVSFDMGIKEFIKTKLKPMCFLHYPGSPILIVGDPSGIKRNDTDDNNCFKELKKAGFKTKAAFTNDPVIRINAIDSELQRFYSDKPMFVVDKSCKWFISGLRSKYRYAKIRGKEGIFKDRPDKNDWSHTIEAGQYGVMYATSNKYREDDFVRIGGSGIATVVQKYNPACAYTGY